MSGEPDQAAGLRWAEVTSHDRQPFDTNVAHSADEPGPGRPCGVAWATSGSRRDV
jgi:hypothetical protein